MSASNFEITAFVVESPCEKVLPCGTCEFGVASSKKKSQVDLARTKSDLVTPVFLLLFLPASRIALVVRDRQKGC